MKFLQAISPTIRRRSWPQGECAVGCVDVHDIFWRRVFKVRGVNVEEVYTPTMQVEGDDWERLADGGSDI